MMLHAGMIWFGWLSIVRAQQVGHYEKEQGPKVTLKECTETACTEREMTMTLDANWRWIHKTSGYENCYTGNKWTGCSGNEQCARDCALEGVSEEGYKGTYGISQIDNGVRLNFVTEHKYGVNVGSRLYMLDESGQNYKMFYLKNREFAMTFDVSHAECGMNGAMYFIEMDEKGGQGRGNNQAGAKYGTGYCDAQCPHDIKFIDGEANFKGWKPNPKDKSKNMGAGHYGTCCAEMDIWEANSMSNAYTPHPCNIKGQLKCEGIDCGDNDKGERYDGVCDKDGCDINPFRMGNQSFYGKGKIVDTMKPVTTVTQFLTTDGTDDGDLKEIRRYYVQDGVVIHSPPTVILGDDSMDSIDDEFCKVKKDLFGDVNDYAAKGGDKEMGESLDRGHVLAVSLWDDVEVNMLWLDSAFPLDKPKDKPGILRGDCPGGQTSTPEYVRKNFPDGYVSFQNAFVGPIGSFLNPPAPSPTPPSPTPPGGGDGCGCGPAAGQNQPECEGVSEQRCKRIMQFENKCSWKDCPVPTPSPPAPVPEPPAPKPTQPPTPSPNVGCPTPAPKVGCARFCDMQDLVKGKKKNCKFLKKMRTLCEMSYVTRNGKVVPCEIDSKKKRCMDSKKPEECDLETACAASLSETGHGEDEEDESGDEDEDEFDLDDDETDDDLEERLATKAEPEHDTKRKRKGFLHNSLGSFFVQTGSEMEKGLCYEQEQNYEEK